LLDWAAAGVRALGLARNVPVFLVANMQEKGNVNNRITK
jgi:hypothetical protein